MSMIKFACISPHPPLLLPNVGSEQDKQKVKKTIESLEFLGKSLKELNPDIIIISSPHPDWGFNVPLHFLAKDFKGEIKTFLTEFESPEFYFEEGKNFYSLKIQTSRFAPCNSSGIKKNLKLKIALIASGDLSHCLKEDGPYGFNPQGPKFDKKLIESLKKKDIDTILKLDEMYPEAGECGLRSFSFLLGILEAAKINWQPEILSYENPFGVGYLLANFKLPATKN